MQILIINGGLGKSHLVSRDFEFDKDKTVCWIPSEDIAQICQETHDPTGKHKIAAAWTEQIYNYRQHQGDIILYLLHCPYNSY